MCLDGDASGSTEVELQVQVSDADLKRNGNILIPNSVVSTIKPYGLLSSTQPKHMVKEGLVCFAVSESHWAESW